MLGRTVSHYTVLERLGGGGMGVVYKALDTRLDRHVALKFLSPELSSDETSKKRFIQEAKAASALDHPNICTIYEIDQTDDGSLFIAMAFYEGETLKKKLNRLALPLSTLIEIANQVATGLTKAHERRIIHRDIKPANLMITNDQIVKIVDFGLAKLTGQGDMTRTGSALGTAAYMSPEQAQGIEVDHRTDIWSWGVVLYEMVTGRLPFQGENALSLFHSIVSEQHTPVSALRNDISPAFDRLLAKALQKDPQKRHASILEAAQELQKISVSPDVSVVLTKSAGVYVESKTVPSTKTEKKQVAVVKSLIPSYAELLEHLSSQELQALLKSIRDELTQIAETFHGVINEFSGDQFILIFGIPAAGEDDFVRAVRASLLIHSRIQNLASKYETRIGNSLTVQSGIATGLVVVRPSNSSDRKYELTGNAVQLATTLATHAESGEVWIPEDGRRSLEHFFEIEVREEIPLKGKARKLKPYRIAGESAESRFDSWQKEELTTYAGRNKELELLQGKLETAARGDGQFVAVIGEAGVGKSRLLYEFRRALDPHSARILQGGGRLYASNVAYSPFIEALRDDLKLREKGNLEHVAVEQIIQLDRSLTEFIPIYLHLLAIPTNDHGLPKHLRGKELQLAIGEALCAFVLSRKDGPVVLLLEDWHAADEASQNILAQLQEMIPGYPILIVVTCRPECSFRAAAHHTTVFLGPLDESSSKTIIKSALRAENAPSDLIDLVIERTGGNPFFIEEICQTLREEGIVKIENRVAVLTQSLDRLRLPDTIQSVIGSRLDRIDPDARRVLEIASVVGRDFNRALLQKLMQDEARLFQSLELLKTLGLIQQIRVLPEASYKFKHPLVQETAYEALLAHERKNLHGLVGEAIEELYADRLEEHSDVLAHHFSMAERWDKAVHFGRQAARKAIAIGHFTVALHQLERVEYLLANLAQNRETQNVKVDVLLNQERLCETLGIRDRQEEILNRVLGILHETSDRALLTEVYRRLGELYTLIGRFEEGEKALNTSLQLSVERADLSGERNAHRGKGFLYWHQGRNVEAVDSNELALAIDRKRNDAEGLATDLMNLTSVLRALGRNDRALECAEEALKNYETVDDPVKRATAFHLVANIYRELADDERALRYFEQAMEISSRYRLVNIQSFHLTAIASIYWKQGKTEESLKLLTQSVELCRRSGYADGLAHSLRTMGELLISANKSGEAVPYLEEAALLFSKLKDQANAALMYETLGRINREQGDITSAVAFYMEALEAAEKPETLASLRNTLGILEWNRANYEAALGHFREAFELFQKTGDMVHAGLILNSIGVTLKNLGEIKQAVAALKQAVDLNRKTDQRLLEGHSLSALGEIFYESGEFGEAAECFRKSLAIRKEIRDRKGEGWMLYQLARVYASQKAESLARESFAEARQIASECGEEQLIRACNSFESILNAK